MELSAEFIPLILISVLAFWKENAVLFMVAAGLAIMTGLYSPDLISGNLGISAGLMLIMYSLVCCGLALRMMFWKEE